MYEHILWTEEPFVNIDGVDARGPVRLWAHRGDAEQRKQAVALAGELLDAFSRNKELAKVGSLPPGVLVDGVVLARAGMPGVTVSRGDVATLGAVHTRRDTPERTDVGSAVRVGRIVASVLAQRLG